MTEASYLPKPKRWRYVEAEIAGRANACARRGFLRGNEKHEAAAPRRPVSEMRADMRQQRQRGLKSRKSSE